VSINLCGPEAEAAAESTSQPTTNENRLTVIIVRANVADSRHDPSPQPRLNTSATRRRPAGVHAYRTK
jgi:hypothetical protein